MSKLRFIVISISLIILVNTTLLSKPVNPVYKSMSVTAYAGFDLSKKSYYEEIFTKDERKELKKATKYMAAAEKYMAKYDADQREIEKLYTIAEATSSPKSREKSLKKARKLESKSLKNGLKALEYYKKGTDIQNKIYIAALNRARLNDDSKNSKLGREIELQAKTVYEAGKTKERTTPQHDDQLKFNTLREANDMILKALSMQESAFGFYKNDPSVNADNFNVSENTNVVDSTKQVVKVDSVLFPVYVEQYNALTDPNLYRSKANIILPRLNLSSEDLSTIVEANRKNQYANDLLRQVDEAYMIVDSLNFVADRTEDFNTRDEIRNRAIEKEQNAFYKLTNATNIYLDVNDIRYKIYKKHYPNIDPGKRNTETDRAKKYENEAEEYYQKAKGDIAGANKLMYRSEQYLKLMGANDLMLYALQLQENAYGIYFNIPEAISAAIDTSFIAENKINESNVATNKESTSSSLSWELLSSFTYSKEKPKPVNYVTKKGVVFLVQMGIFKGLLPPDKFGNIQPLVFDKFVKNPYRRYMVGEYRTLEAAQLALEKVRTIGYTDAYIIALIDGERRSLSYGQAKVNPSDEQYAYLKRMEIAKINGQKEQVNNIVNTNNVNKEGEISGNSVTNTQGLLYFIQLGMYLKPVNYADLKNLQPIYTHKITGKGTRYLYGNFGTMTVARNENQKAKNLGFKDSYVTAYYNGEHISLDKAKKLEKQHYGTVSENIVVKKSTGKITFMVQIGAYQENLSSAEINTLNNTFSPRTVDHKFSGGMNVYTVGNYTSYKEADYLKKKLISEGHKDVFVVAFDGNDKIPVGEAIKRNQ